MKKNYSAAIAQAIACFLKEINKKYLFDDEEGWFVFVMYAPDQTNIPPVMRHLHFRIRVETDHYFVPSCFAAFLIRKFLAKQPFLPSFTTVMAN